MKVLEAMEQEFKAIVCDIKQHPNHVHMYDMETMTNELCIHYLCSNNEYNELAKESYKYFNIIRENIDSKCFDYLNNYEDIQSKKEDLILASFYKMLMVINE